jgi:large subunit ribosomal protein L22
MTQKSRTKRRVAEPTGKSGGATEVSRATLRDLRMSPRKARLVIDLIRGRRAEVAVDLLRFSPKKGAVFARKLLESAIANARNIHRADVDTLKVTGGWVDEGRTLKRYMPAAHGRANPIRKRSSHMTIVLGY